VKNRITQDKVNAAIDEIRTIIEAKYKILASNYIKLSGETLKRFKVKYLLFRTYLFIYFFRLTKKKKQQIQRESYSFRKILISKTQLT
jgi:uncharacterized protein Veg